MFFPQIFLSWIHILRLRNDNFKKFGTQVVTGYPGQFLLAQGNQAYGITHWGFSSLREPVVNSLWPTSDITWNQRFWSTLVQVMACCLTAPSHHLNQCWLLIIKVPSTSQDICGNAFDVMINQHMWPKMLCFKWQLVFPKGRWVNSLLPGGITFCSGSWSVLIHVMHG